MIYVRKVYFAIVKDGKSCYCVTVFAIVACDCSLLSLAGPDSFALEGVCSGVNPTRKESGLREYMLY